MMPAIPIRAKVFTTIERGKTSASGPCKFRIGAEVLVFSLAVCEGTLRECSWRRKAREGRLSFHTYGATSNTTVSALLHASAPS
jgi:hypothetical protein